MHAYRSTIHRIQVFSVTPRKENTEMSVPPLVFVSIMCLTCHVGTTKTPLRHFVPGIERKREGMCILSRFPPIINGQLTKPLPTYVDGIGFSKSSSKPRRAHNQY